jgi:cysteine desulfurase
MDLAGVAVSAGSACSSGKVKVSHVARAMGYTDNVAGSVLRVSLGWNTVDEDIERCIANWQTLFERVQKHTSQAA